MRQLYFLICILTFTSVNAFGQFWNKPETIYSFNYRWGDSKCSYGNENGIGFKQLSVYSDTMIDGKLFTRYHDYSILYTPSWPTGYYDTISTISEMAFYEEDSILYAHHVNMDTYDVVKLYDFTKLPGQSWTVPQVYFDATDPWGYLCGSNITITVVDTGHLMFQSSNLYYLKVNYSGLANNSSQTDTIFERFGGKKFSFLSISKRCKFDGPSDCDRVYYLKCYSDNEISFGENCTDAVSVNEVDKDKFSIYPNPSNTVVRIRTRSKQIYLTDILGKVIFTVAVKNDTADIDVSGLTDGVYFLTTTDGYSNKLIVQH